MDAEKYITLMSNSFEQKKKVVQGLQNKTCICAMNRSTWRTANTVSLSIMALRLPKPNEILMGHKWVDGAFVDIRATIKQEQDNGGASGNTGASNKKGKGKAKANAGSDEDSEISENVDDMMDIISITDDSGAAASTSSTSSSNATSSSSSSSASSSGVEP